MSNVRNLVGGTTLSIAEAKAVYQDLARIEKTDGQKEFSAEECDAAKEYLRKKIGITEGVNPKMLKRFMSDARSSLETAAAKQEKIYLDGNKGHTMRAVEPDVRIKMTTLNGAYMMSGVKEENKADGWSAVPYTQL